MDFIDQVKGLASLVPKQLEHCGTEEATKNALVLPFIQALGYNVFDPIEVMPEYSADFGTKIASKCDYAVCQNGSPIMLFECKWSGKELEKKDEDQLRQYFGACPSVKIGVLTNGLLYKFFTDLEESNYMDRTPFFEFDIMKAAADAKGTLIEDLKRFTKDTFDTDKLVTAAIQLRYTNEIKRIIAEEFKAPSTDFAKYFASRVHLGKKVTESVLNQFKALTKEAFKQYMSERFVDTAKSVIEDHDREAGEEEESKSVVGEPVRVPTPEEVEGFHLVRALLYDTVPPERVYLRPSKTKPRIGIILDDSKKKPICRLHLNGQTKYVGLWEEVDPGEGRKENKIVIDGLMDLYGYAERLKAIVNYHLNPHTTAAAAQNAQSE